jgi:hypothetical protein
MPELRISRACRKYNTIKGTIMSKPIHILITVTEDGESVAYERWVSEEEMALYLEGCAKQPVREKAK